MILVICALFTISTALENVAAQNQCLVEAELKRQVEAHSQKLEKLSKFQTETLKWQLGLISVLPKSYSLNLFKFLSSLDVLADIAASEPWSNAQLNPEVLSMANKNGIFNFPAVLNIIMTAVDYMCFFILFYL